MTRKTSTRIRHRAWIFPLLVIVVSSARAGNSQTGGSIDLSSPEAAINSYCEAADLSAIREIFHPSGQIEEDSFKKPIWTECKIIKSGKTKLVGKHLGNGLIAQRTDVEVITEVKMIDPQKGNPKTKFWYLLRNIEGKWKIIS